MSTNIDFKDLWQQQKAVMPNVSSVYTLVNTTKRKLLWKLAFTNIGMVLTSAFIIAIWIYFQPQLLTTKIGISLIIFAMLVFLFVYNQMVPYLKKTSNAVSASEYIIQLKQIQVKLRFIQTTMMHVYYILLSLGVYLYMYEYTAKTILGFGINYGITSLWFAFNWFYVLPKSKKKQQLKTDGLIAQLEKLQNQLGE
jgi:multisubunit Na+/H+ antiporter MnhC subunit